MQNNKNYYFSDDEIDSTQNNTNNNETDIGNDSDSLDEETRKIIYNKFNKDLNKDDLDAFEKIQKGIKTKKTILNNSDHNKQQNNKNKKSQILTLSNFSKMVNAEKPKKFISKRVLDKKQQLDILNDKIKRQFNPKLPPYNYVFQKNNSNNNINFNINDFPKL